MNVTFKTPQKLGNKEYKAGQQVLPDHLASNALFKALVKSGQAIVHARNENEQKVQAMKDAQNARKAESARKLTAKMLADKADK
jgi:hypothetical protein